MYGEMFMVFLMVSVICLTVLIVLKMAFRHAENMKRIAHGYPTLDSSRGGSSERSTYGETNRLQ